MGSCCAGSQGLNGGVSFEEDAGVVGIVRGLLGYIAFYSLVNAGVQYRISDRY
jgi:hypothetical protein